MEPYKAVYINVKQGGKHIVDAQQMEYRVTRRKEHKTYYQCVMKNKNMCPATAIVSNETDDIVQLSGEHNHDSDLLKRKVRARENDAIKEAATNSSVSPRSVLGNITNEVTTDFSLKGICAMSKSNAIVQAIKRARYEHNEFPKVPKTWDEMIVPNHLCTTIRGDTFLALEESTGTDEKILVFCSSEQKTVLHSAAYWICDGTFEVVSETLFYQLFIISAITKTGITMPCLFALLPNKEIASYQIVFQHLKDSGVEPPGYMNTDFEKAIFRSFTNVFPHIPIRGCDVHFKRALRRKITSTEIGLGSFYQSQEKVKKNLVHFINKLFFSLFMSFFLFNLNEF